MKNENVLIWGFCGEDGKAIVDRLELSLNIVDWFSDQKDSIDIWDILQGKFPSDDLCSIHLDKFPEFFKEHFHTYEVMINRRGLKFSDLHELINEFSISYHYFCNLVSKKQVRLIISANLPHEGADYVLYQVAKMLKVKTLMCYQNIFPNQFFVITKLEDFGLFNTVPAIFSPEKILLEPGFKQNVSYMNDIERKQTAQAKGGWALFWFTLNNIIEKSQDLIVKIFKLIRDLESINFMRIAKKIETLNLQLIYKKNNDNYVIDNSTLDSMLNGNNKIVYFPLHLQPELTTSAIGGVFQDQLLAIEILRNLLDDDWLILVKENPKQNHYQRGKLFFDRLKRIPGTYWVDKYYPSQKILQKSSLTAVISGTAGWEAIKGGSKSIVFGQAWYSSFTGCLNYQKSVTRSKMLEFISSESDVLKVNKNFELISKKAGIGVVDPEYKGLVKDYSLEINSLRVVESLMAIIRHQKTIW